MDDVVARCPDCGNEQPEAFANCFICMKPSRWWCRCCVEWRPTRACPACAPRLEFLPALVVLRTPTPGGTVRTSVALKNPSKVTLTANLTTTAKWLKAEPKSLSLAPGETVQVKLHAKTKKTDSGPREAKLMATAPGGPYEATVRYSLPEPELAAEPVDFGEMKPGRAAIVEMVLRNTGRVRVHCTIAAGHDWLRVLPNRVNLPPGREKKLRVRALLTAEQDGPQASELLVAGPTGPLLHVPVTAVGRVPKGVLRAVRKQRVRDAVGPPVERKFQVANDGDGPLVVTAVADQPWVKILTPELRVGAGKKRKLRYEIDLPAMARGEHVATFTLTSNGGTATVPLTVQVLDPNPVLEVLPAPELGLVSPELVVSTAVQIRNAGIGLLTVQAKSESSRVTVTPDELEVAPGPPVRLNLLIPLEGLPGGDHSVGVQLTSNGGNGRAAVRFHLPVEQIDVPAMIDLGNRPAGRLTGDALRVRNTGPHRVTLRVRGADQWLRPGAERITVNPGETVSVPFRMDLPPDVLGPIMSSLIIEGRAVKHTVAVRAIARKVDLIVLPGVVVLGELTPGTEHAFIVDVVNAGEINADIRETHVPGELEVWVRGATVQPGQRVTVAGRVRVNTRQTHQQVRVSVPLADEATLRLVARVVPSVLPKVVALTAAVSGLLAGGALAATIAWWLGVPIALVGIATGAWLFWLDMR